MRFSMFSSTFRIGVTFAVTFFLLLGCSAGTSQTYTITTTHGAGQSRNINTTFPNALVVTVKDSSGNVVSGKTVNFSVPTSGASAVLSSSTAITDASGQAIITATAGTSTGSYNVTASTTGASASALIGLTNTNNAASAITVVQGSGQSQVVGTAYPSSLQARVKDSGGNAIAGVTVNLTDPGSGASASLSTASGVTDSNGLITVTATANTVTGSYNVTAAVSGGSPSTTFALTNTVGAAASSIASGNPQSAQVGVAFSTALGIKIGDSYGNPISGVTVTFTSPGSGAKATLSASTAVTNSSGIASVTATANTTTGAYNVTASATGVTTQSFSLTNTAGAPATLTLTSGSAQSTQLNTTFPQLLVAKVADTYGNPVSGTPITFTPPSSTATATLWGVPTGTSGAVYNNTSNTGVASITALARGVTGSYSITATTPGVSGSVSYTLTNQAISSSVIAQVTIDSYATPTITVPGDFVSLSHQQGDVQNMIGYMPTYGGTITMNPIYEKLIDNVQTITGAPMVLRMLGDGHGPTTLHNSLPVLNKLYTDKATKYFMGIDFVEDDTSVAVSEVEDITSGVLNSASIQAIELGNEPDGYVAGGAKTSYSYTQYLADEQTFWDAINPHAGGLKFATPVFTGNDATYSENDYLTNRASHVSMFNFHYYGGQNCNASGAPTQPYLLTDTALTTERNYPANSYLSSAIATARSQSIPHIRAGEMNSIACHGAFGISDTFTSALWAMDMGMTYAASGVTGINYFLHTDQTYNKAYSGSIAYNAFDFTYTTVGTTRTWKLAYVAPEYYAMMMINMMIKNSAGVISSPVISNPGRFHAWATREAGGALHIMLLNKEDGTNGAVSPVGEVQVMLGNRGTATVTRLKANNIFDGWWDPTTGTLKTDGTVTGRTGITMNGQTFDASTDGSIQGTLTPETVTPVNGTYTLNVPVANAVILTIP